MVCITLLCVQPIPILSAFFLCHPYIPLSNLKNFSFTCYSLSYIWFCTGLAFGMAIAVLVSGANNGKVLD